MGLYGALVVLPSTAGRAYAGADSAYDSESVLVLGELDPKLANADDPAGFDMTGYHPSYWLINGHTYDGPDADTIPPIEAAPGDRVLLRYVNAGVYDHSMGILRAHQHVVGYAGVEEKHPYDAVAESVNPGQTMDTVVALPNTGADGAKYLISDQGQHLDDAGAGWSNASGVPVSSGGMMTFINAAGLPAACYGSTTSKVLVGTLDAPRQGRAGERRHERPRRPAPVGQLRHL